MVQPLANNKRRLWFSQHNVYLIIKRFFIRRNVSRVFFRYPFAGLSPWPRFKTIKMLPTCVIGYIFSLLVKFLYTSKIRFPLIFFLLFSVFLIITLTHVTSLIIISRKFFFYNIFPFNVLYNY